MCCDDDFLCGLYGLVSNVHFLGHQVLPGILSCLGAAGKTHPTGHSIGEPYTVAEEIHTGILPSLTAEISPFRHRCFYWTSSSDLSTDGSTDPGQQGNSDCSPCPHNWIQNGKSCYYVFERWEMWNISKKSCLKEGASLFQIDSKEEMEFISSIGKLKGGNKYWVGVFQDGISGSWFWEDGSSPLSDLLPAERQRSAGQICGYLKDSTLISDKCDSWKYFICEKKAFGSCI